MQEYRVVILAAGAGSRLGTKTVKSHKALIRVGEKAVISHIVDIFPVGVTFVIGVGHNALLVQEYLNIAHADRTFIYVPSEYGSGYGPGYSLGKCRDHLQMPFYYFDCDTIITNFELDQSESWVACARISASESSKYCTVIVDAEAKHVSGFIDKAVHGTTLAWTGAAFVKDCTPFWKALENNSSPIRGELQIAPALFSLPHLRAKSVNWFDTGNETGLATAREVFQTVGNLGRNDEEIYFRNGSVIKYYEEPARLEKIAVRMNSLRQVMPPIIERGKHFLKYRYTPGADMSRVERPDEHIVGFLKCCENNLWTKIDLPKSKLDPFKAGCLRFYRDKTIARVKDAFAKLAIDDGEMLINGRMVPPLGDILQKRIDWNLMSDGLPSRYHGDLNLSNVILSSDGSFTLVDCREEFAGDMSCGDRYYDLAKIYQSFLLPHHSIRCNDYKVTRKTAHNVAVTIGIPGTVAKAEKLFDKWAGEGGYNLGKIRLISAMTLVNIAVLHDFPLTELLLYYGWYSMCSFLGRTLEWRADHSSGRSNEIRI